ncbi:hypothetical protein [Gilvimarinus polysaccharolyticus]|uniref:hypothetical protein n=1 Tax=Gilvimarinus polysaccharolyticus TaxID=863921 RepID=UPI000673138A|nr:hypothetical protein [Gilvimarinus polysaccharolyticus]
MIKLSFLQWATLASELLSFWLIYQLWKTSDYLFFKATRTALTLIPILGPLFYLFTAKPPNNMPAHLRDKPNSTDYVDLGHRPNYTEKWQQQRPELAKKIRQLKNSLGKKY